jgi:phage-related protein
VRREWKFFDDAVIQSELDALPAKDVAKLTSLMEHFAEVGLGNPSPVQIDDYGIGIYRLRHIKPAYQGRLLYFAVERSAGFERLIVLTVFKKENQEVPRNVLERAKSRMEIFKSNERKNG